MNIYDVTREFQGAFVAPRTSTKFLVVHHAAAHYPQSTGIEDVRAIANYHVKTRGWAGVGYHEILAQETNGGPIACYLVSRPDSIRAHVWGRNHECFGISCATDFATAIPDQKWIDALSLRLVVAQQRWPSAQIVGHKDITLKGHETTCPGSRWLVWKPALVAQVASMLKQQRPPAGDIWASWGTRHPLPPDQRGFGIPSLWKENRWLGEARSAPMYPPDAPGVVVQVFQGGLIWAFNDVTQLAKFGKTLP